MPRWAPLYRRGKLRTGGFQLLAAQGRMSSFRYDLVSPECGQRSPGLGNRIVSGSIGLDGVLKSPPDRTVSWWTAEIDRAAGISGPPSAGPLVLPAWTIKVRLSINSHFQFRAHTSAFLRELWHEFEKLFRERISASVSAQVSVSVSDGFCRQRTVLPSQLGVSCSKWPGGNTAN